MTYDQTLFQKTRPGLLVSQVLPDWSAVEDWIRRFWRTTPPETRPQPPRETGLGPLTFGHLTTTEPTLFLPDDRHPVRIGVLETPTTVGLRLELTDQTLEILQTTPAHAGLRIGAPERELRRVYGPHRPCGPPQTGAGFTTTKTPRWW